MLLTEEGDSRSAVGALQRALSLVERDMPLRVYEAMGAVGGALLETGHVLAAQAHLWLHAALAPRDDTRSREVLAALHHYSGLPLLLRDQLGLRPWPDAPWKAEAEKASRLADNGKWKQAVEIIDSLGQKYGADPTLVFNRALLGGWLADDRALVAGLHAYSQLDVPLDDAVEAEAIAQLLDPDLREPRLDSLIQVYAIHDLDGLVMKLLSDRRVQAFEMDPAALEQSDQPRPRHTFVLLDRMMPESGADLTRDDVTRLSAVLAVYGRQTDRPERLEFTVDRGARYDATLAALKEIVGDAIGELLEERVIGSVSATDQALNWRWQLPRDTPREDRRRLINEERRAAIVERWPTLSIAALGGKTPREAADDPQMRIPLMAAVLILEQGGNAAHDAESVAELCNELKLPQPETVEPTGAKVGSLPLVRVPRLDLSKIADDDLAHLYRRSVMVGAQAATVGLAREVLQRPSIASQIPPADAYQRLLAAESDPDRALALIDEARERTRAAGDSTAAWDLAELELHITSGNVDEAKLALGRIEREHRDDPNVAAALYRLLYETGVIPEDAAAQAPMFDETPAAAVSGDAEPPASRLWTPGSDRPSSGKSPLWTPS